MADTKEIENAILTLQFLSAEKGPVYVDLLKSEIVLAIQALQEKSVIN